MTNVINLTTKEPIEIKTIEDHIAEIQSQCSSNMRKAITILVDESNGTTKLTPIYTNINNGDLFMIIGIMNHHIVNEIHEK